MDSILKYVQRLTCRFKGHNWVESHIDTVDKKVLHKCRRCGRLREALLYLYEPEKQRTGSGDVVIEND